jgi:F-type H+-transporting ATPase subunit b
MNNNRKWTQIALAVMTAGAVVGIAGVVMASGADPHAAADAHAVADAHGAAHGGPLSPEKLKDLGWRVMNFAALVIILVKFLKKPLADGLKNRKEGIRAEFEDLEARRGEAEREYKEYEGKLAGIDDELKTMVENAVAQGQKEKERIIEEAERAAESIQRQAEMAVQNEIADAKRRLKAEITEQAAVMAEEIIKKNLQDADQDKLVDDYLTKVGGLR